MKALENEQTQGRGSKIETWGSSMKKNPQRSLRRYISEVGWWPRQYGVSGAKRMKCWKEKNSQLWKIIQNSCAQKGEGRENYLGICPFVPAKNVFFLPKSSVSSAMWWCKVMGWVGRHGWLVFGMCNPPVPLLPWLLMILARNISMGMCAFAMPGV